MSEIKLNNYIIETEVVDEIKKVMRRTRRIIPELKENDKTISWDGELMIFSEANQNINKKNFSNKIPLQVKGTQVNKFSNQLCKHSINIDDLKNYYKDGGVIFFKGEIVVKSEEVYEVKLFYKNLLPIDIKEILKEKGNQGSVVQNLMKLPKGNHNVIALLEKFIQDRELQSVHLLENNTKKINEFDKLKISPKNIDTKFENLLEESFYVYGVESENITIPLCSIIFNKKIEETNIKVSIDEEIYFNKVTRISKSDECTILNFGSNINFTFRPNSKKVKFDFEINGTNLSLIIKTLKFLIDFERKKYFHINDLKIEGDNLEFNNMGILENELIYAEALNDLLNYFSMELTTPIREFPINYLKNIVIIRDSLLFKKNVSNNNLKNGLYQLSLDLIDNKVLLFVHKDKNSTVFQDYYNITKDYSISYDLNNIKSTKISPFLSLKSNELLHINFNKDKIFSSIKSYNLNYDVAMYLNNFILELIKAFDKSQNEDYLDLCLNLIDLINNNFSDDSILINYLQILIRKNKSIDNFYSKLFDLENSDAPLIRCCSYILTGSYKKFEYQFNSLSDEDKVIFKQFPIYKLYLDYINVNY